MPPTISTDSVGTVATPALSRAAHKFARRKWRTAWIVLAIGLAITATAAVYVQSRVDELAERAFTFHCNEVQNAISGRLDDHARILLGGAALFNASDSVSREEWRIFTKHQKVETQLPGIQGIGFSLLIPRAELARHIQAIRDEGFPEYRVKPEGDREFYSSIIYLEPFSDRNLRAFGYDMFSEAVRREAMELARDTDYATLSGKVVLVQETDKNAQAGTLMYVPVYRKGMPTDTVEHRRAALHGWVYSPYRMRDLMGGILGGRDLEKELRLHFRLFDGERPSAESLLCGCCPAESEKLWSPVRFTRQKSVDFNGHRWTVSFTQLGGGFFTAEYAAAWLTMAGGIVITVLLSGLVHTLQNTRDEAERMADTLSVDLRRSEAHYHAIVDQAADGIFIMTCEGEILEVNDAFAHMHGYTAKELLATGLAGLDVPESREQVPARIQRILAGETLTFEVEHLRKDGSRFPLEVNASLVDLGDKKCIMAFHRDITERKTAATYADTAREVLQILNEPADRPDSIPRVLAILKAKIGVDAVGLRLQEGDDFPYIAQDGFPEDFLLTENTLVDRGPDGMACRDKDGNVRLECTCGLVLFGKAEPGNPLFTRGGSFWTNDSASLLDLPSDEDPQFHPRKQCARQGYASIALVPVRNKDKIVGLLQLNGRKRGCFTLAGVEHLEGIAAHIGEAMMHRQADVELRDQRRRLENVIEATRVGTWEWNIQTGEVVFNEIWAQIVGYSLDELSPVSIKTWEALVHPDDLRRSGELLKRLFSGDLPYYDCECRMRHKDGHWVWVHDRGQVITRTGDGKPLVMSGGHTDITDRKELQADLLQAQKMEAVGLLAGGVAHDFRNQLTVIMGYSQMLLRRSMVTEEGRDMLEEVLKAAERSSMTTGQLLAYSRREILCSSVRHIRDCVASIGKVLSHVVTEDIHLTILSDGHDATANIDAHLFQQAIMNLATNARDAMPKGGTLTIETTCVTLGSESQRIDPELAEGPYVVVSVSDTGSGMDEATLARAFDPFFTTKEVGQGSGLGLAMVYGFVKQSGGSVVIQSELGHGTTVRLYFPRVVSASVEGVVRQETKPLRRGNETVLLVEDEPALRLMAVDLLREAGYHVLEAASAEGALLLVERHSGVIDILVSDIVMPGMSGVALAERLLAMCPGMGLLLMSGYPREDLAKRGVAASMNIVVKPFDPELLLEEVRNVLDTRRTAR